MSQPAIPAVAADLLAAHAADSRAIVDRLRRVVAVTGDTSFLIVSVGDVYIQYISEPGSKTLAVEAVSNHNLPEAQRVGPGALAALRAIGFAEPESDDENYAMDCEASTDAELASLAALAIHAIYGIYACDPDARLEFELALD